MSTHRFTQVDVFADAPLQGNPLAVVHDADDIADDRMQAFARWTNLSETTFLLPPTDPAADYRVRIFTPGGELPFAGHPTLGSCHAWLERGGRPHAAGEVVQQCGVGNVRIRRDGGSRAAFAAPPLRSEAVDEPTLAAAVSALGLRRGQVAAARWLTNGPVWLTLLLDSAATVLALAPDHTALASLATVGVVGAHPAGHDCRFEVRAFTAPVGVPEDPVTGSLNAALAEWLTDTGVAPRSYVAAQGTCLGRAGRVHLQRDADAIWVGGNSISIVSGEVTL